MVVRAKAEAVFESGDLTACYLERADASDLQALFEACPDYHLLGTGCSPTPNAADEMYVELPPGKTLGDKVLLGLFDDAGCLHGVIDLIRDYPDAGIWYLGLFLLRPNWRSKGVGARIHEALLGWCVSLGAQTIRLGVVERNQAAGRFWSRLGYEAIATTQAVMGTEANQVIVMARPLLRRPSSE